MYPQQVVVWTTVDDTMSITVPTGLAYVPADIPSEQLKREDIKSGHIKAMLPVPPGFRLATPPEIDLFHLDQRVLEDRAKHYVVPDDGRHMNDLTAEDFTILNQPLIVPEGCRLATALEVAIHDIPPNRIKPGTVPHEVLRQDFPDAPLKKAGRDFRDAWHHEGPEVKVHMGKAREIHKNRLRGHRAEKLAALDVDYQRADESGDNAKKAKIAARKNKLRDITKHPEIDAAQTPAELRLAAMSVLTEE